MKYFESWWQRAPQNAMALRVGLAAVGLLALVLGGSADGYWS